MNNKILNIMIVLSLFFVFSIQAQTQSQSKVEARKERASAVHAEFQKIIDSYYAAWNKGNTTAPAAFYAKDADLVFYDIAPMKYTGWKEYSAGVEKNFFQNAKSVQLTPNDDLKVTRRGTVTWTTLTFRLVGQMKDGKTTDFQCRHTAIWEKRGGKWLVVHEHVSTPLPQ